jgi:hypothetical protein
MKAPLLEELKIRVRGVPPLERLAGMIVLGMQMRHLKVMLGYMGAGSQWAYKGEERPGWNELCRAQAGFTDDTEKNLHECARAVKARLAAKSTDEAREILSMMERPPSELADAERENLVAGICRHALKAGDTQESLRKESAEIKPDGKMGQPEMDEVLRILEVVCHSGPTHKYHRKLMALGMACGFSESRAREVADYMIDRRRQKKVRLHSIVMAALKNGEASRLINEFYGERRKGQ